MIVIEREFEDYDISMEAWERPKPFGISGCFRLRDEAQFMTASILSHLPYLDEAVLVTQPSKDDTVVIAGQLEREHPDKIRHYHYPFDVRFIDHPDWHRTHENSIYSFVYLSNWALSKCRYSWIAKTEGDVICLDPFRNIVDAILAAPDITRYYGRVILNVAGAGMDHISLENPRNGGLDEAVFNNTPAYRFYKNDRWESITIHDAVSMGWSALHLKRCKTELLPTWNGEHYIPWTRDNVAMACKAYNRDRGAYPGIDGDALGQQDCLYQGVPYYHD